MLPLESTEPPLRSQTRAASTSILLVDGDPEYLALLEREIAGDERLEVQTERSSTDALARIDGVDCVVSALATEPTTGLELLEEIRARDPTLPFVLHTNASVDAVLESLLAHEWTDYLQKGGPASIELLRRRIHRLVERRRSNELAGRTLAVLDAVRDGIAIVDRDGTVQFANRQYAAHFGTDPDTVIGTHWRDRYPDAEVARLESEAIPTAEDGWRWTGACTGRRADGSTFSTRTSLVGLDDGRFLILLAGPDGHGRSDRRPER